MENFFYYSLVVSFALPPLTFLLRGRGYQFQDIIPVVLIYCIFFLLLNLYFDQLEKFLGGNFYYLIYTILEFTAFVILISHSEKKKGFKNTVAIVWGAFFLFCLTRYFNKSYERMDSYEIAFESLVIISLVIYFFYLRLKHVDEQYLYQNPFFWLMTGMLVYLGFTFFFNILVNHVDNEVIRNYYHFSYIGDIIKNCLFAIALLQLPRTKPVIDPSQTFNAPKLDLI